MVNTKPGKTCEACSKDYRTCHVMRSVEHHGPGGTYIYSYHEYKKPPREHCRLFRYRRKDDK